MRSAAVLDMQGCAILALDFEQIFKDDEVMRSQTLAPKAHTFPLKGPNSSRSLRANRKFLGWRLYVGLTREEVRMSCSLVFAAVRYGGSLESC